MVSAILFLAFLASASAAPSVLPPDVRAVIDAALASGEAEAVAAVMRFAKQAHPAAEAEIEAIHTSFRETLAARQAEEERRRHAALAAASALENWSGQVEFGASRSTGNTSNLGLYAALAANRKGLDWQHKLDARAEIQETNGVRSTERILASWQPRYKVGERSYLFGLGQYEHDPFVGFSDRYTAGLGAGYTLIAATDMRLDLEGGPAFRHTDEIVGPGGSTIAARASADFAWVITPSLELKQTGSFYLEEDNGSGRATTALDARLLGDLKLRLSYELHYERDAFRGVDSLGTTSRATVVYGF